MAYTTVFFDLDGTLTDSAPGILEATERTLQRYGIHLQKEERLRFVGPPLTQAFREFCGFSQEKAEDALVDWRRIYHGEKLWRSVPFPGIPEVLSRLSEKKKRLVVATSKPEGVAHDLLTYTGLLPYFEVVVGATLDDSRSDKVTVIREALLRCGRPAGECLMVGDRRYDTEGAMANGMDSLGVLYGYGTREELQNATYIAENVNDILHFC